MIESFFRVTLVPDAYYRAHEARRDRRHAEPWQMQMSRVSSPRVLFVGSTIAITDVTGPTYWPRDTSNRSIAGYYYASPCCSTGRPTNNTPRAFSNEPAGRARDRIFARASILRANHEPRGPYLDDRTILYFVRQFV